MNVLRTVKSKLISLFKSAMFLRITAILLVFSLVAAGFVAYSYYKTNLANKKLMQKIDTLVPPQSEESLLGALGENGEVDESQLKFLYKDFGVLLDMNPDTVGWVKMLDTGVDYPVVKAGDNAFYLDHNFAAEQNEAGWIFADYRCAFPTPSKNTVLYGHLRGDYTMFGSLSFCLQPWWYERPKNMYIWFNTANQRGIYRIYSIYLTEPNDYYITTDFTSDKEYSDFMITEAGKNQVPTVSTYANTSAETLTLSTCFEGTEKRIVIHAMLIKSESYYMSATTDKPSPSRKDPYVEPQSTPETPQSEPETPQSEPETPQSEPETPQSEPETPQSEPETPQSEPETPQSEPETPQSEPETPQTEPETPQSEPETPQSEPETPQTEPETPQTE